MRLGFHISIAGGFKNVIARALDRGCETIQLFSRNPRGWKYNPLKTEDLEAFKKQAPESGISPIFVHMPYLPNLASPRPELFKLSVTSLVEDLKRTEKIGAKFLIMHAGSAEDKDQGRKSMIVGIKEALEKIDNDVSLLIENTAGGGNELGYSFEQIAEIIDGIGEPVRIGVVLDTAHAFAAGYDLRTKSAVNKTIAEFNDTVGLNRLHMIHFNDSKTSLGSRRDRHWHIAKGEIGQGLAFVLRHPLLQDKPFIMETPRIDLKEDLNNMAMAKSFIGR